jgi:hypothetical protein
LGRNLRQRLFCGHFRREITGNQDILDEESIMVSKERFMHMDTIVATDQNNATTTPQDPTTDEGLWEADPNQLPQEP